MGITILGFRLAVILFTVLIMLPNIVWASEFKTDSLSNIDDQKTYKFKTRQLITPGILILGGCLGINGGLLKPVNKAIRDEATCLRGDHYFSADDWMQYATAPGYAFAAYIPGVKAKHNFKTRLMAGITAYGMMAIVVNTLKHTVKEERPRELNHRSFPSGHSANVFCGAELMRLEYGNVVGACGYIVASSVAFLRIYNDMHWANDVMAGMGIGILAARAAYWMIPWEQRLLGLEKSETQCALMPFYTPETASAGLSCTILF